MNTSPQTAEIIITHSPDETVAWGRAFAEKLRAGDVVALTGELGAGKTCLTKGIAAGLGIASPVTSPTFTLIHEYNGRLPVSHVDLYRLQSPNEALAIGLLDYLGSDGVCIVEWAEKIAGLLPATTWRVKLEIVDEKTRRITLTKKSRPPT
jgi:tRNA threonylcarbamoyladenosine biosynthesis protein TsaE